MKTATIFTALLLLIAIPVNGQKIIEVSQLPSAATEFIKRHFPEAVIKKTKQRREHGERGYVVIFTNKTEIGFWKDGKWREVNGMKKPIPTEFIDERILNYVSESYPESKITRIDYGNNDIRVVLTNRKSLRFYKGDIAIKP